MKKKISSLKTTRLVMVEDLNPYGRLFGGALMSWIDEVAVMLAIRRTQRSCVTLKFSEIVFKEGVDLKDMLDLEAEIIKEGNTSLEILIQVYKTSFGGEERKKVCQATAMFVALGEDGAPTSDWH
jgi:acyl-CoA hydrolase